MKLVGLLSALLASIAMAACPANVSIAAGKQLAGNLINAINTGNLALINGSILASDASISLTIFDGQSCKQQNNLSYFEWAPMAIASGLRFTEAKIVEAFIASVGYTVIVIETVDNRGVVMRHSFNFYAPAGDCNLKMLFQSVTDARCQ